MAVTTMAREIEALTTTDPLETELPRGTISCTQTKRPRTVDAAGGMAQEVESPMQHARYPTQHARVDIFGAAS